VRQTVRAGLSLTSVLVAALPALTQSSLKLSSNSVDLFACPGGLERSVSVTSGSPVVYTTQGQSPQWVRIVSLSYYPHTTPDTLVFTVPTGTPPGEPLDITLTPVDGSGPVVIHVTWTANPPCNPGGSRSGSVTVTPSVLGFFFDPDSPSWLSINTDSTSPVPFSVRTTGQWLSVDSATSYSVTSGAPVTLFLTAHTSSLTSATYQAAIAITPSGQPTILIPEVLSAALAGRIHRALFSPFTRCGEAHLRRPRCSR